MEEGKIIKIKLSDGDLWIYNITEKQWSVVKKPPKDGEKYIEDLKKLGEMLK